MRKPNQVKCTSLKIELSEIGEEAIWESRFTSFFIDNYILMTMRERGEFYCNTSFSHVSFTYNEFLKNFSNNNALV